MSAVALAAEARRDLAELIHTHSLRADTPARVRRSLSILAEFPLAGATLEGRWSGYRFMLGPWRWMIFVYRYDDEQDTVWVLRVYDGRSGASPTAD